MKHSLFLLFILPLTISCTAATKPESSTLTGKVLVYEQLEKPKWNDTFGFLTFEVSAPSGLAGKKARLFLDRKEELKVTNGVIGDNDVISFDLPQSVIAGGELPDQQLAKLKNVKIVNKGASAGTGTKP